MLLLPKQDNQSAAVRSGKHKDVVLTRRGLGSTGTSLVFFCACVCVCVCVFLARFKVLAMKRTSRVSSQTASLTHLSPVSNYKTVRLIFAQFLQEPNPQLLATLLPSSPAAHSWLPIKPFSLNLKTQYHVEKRSTPPTPPTRHKHKPTIAHFGHWELHKAPPLCSISAIMRISSASVGFPHR